MRTAVVSTIGELIRHRALLWALVVRHLSTRYRGSLLGFLWTFLNPLSLMLVYTVVFRYYIRFSEVEHYTVFLFCGLLPWLWFTASMNEGTAAIVSGGHLITKSMFPAHLLPMVAVLTNMINFLLSLPLLFLFMKLSAIPFHSSLLVLPLVILLQLFLSYGLALAFAALNVRFRDVQHIVANVLNFVFFLCPILYPIEVVPERFLFTLALNPCALLTHIYHQVVLEGVLPPLTEFFLLGAFSGLTLLIGCLVYDAHRETFAELL